MKPIITFSFSMMIIVSCLLFTAGNFNSRFQSQRALENKRAELSELQNIYGGKTVTVNLDILTDHDSNLRSLAQNFLMINKTRSEKTSEYTNLFIEFSGDFLNSLNFLNNYLQNDYQYAIKLIELKPLHNGSLSFELVLSDRLS